MKRVIDVFTFERPTCSISFSGNHTGVKFNSFFKNKNRHISMRVLVRSTTQRESIKLTINRRYVPAEDASLGHGRVIANRRSGGVFHAFSSGSVCKKKTHKMNTDFEKIQ